MINSNEAKELSTTGLAKILGKSTQVIFQQLADMNLMLHKGDSWDLTPAGLAKGGIYKNTEKYGRYIVWPESILGEFESGVDDSGSDQTATSIGKHFGVPANRINSILSELGWIKRDVLKGWLVTNLGTKMGGSQARDKKTGIPYVRWPQGVFTNKILISNVLEAKGDALPVPQELPQNVVADAVGFRDKFPPPHRTQDGHYVRSKSEIIIDNWLYVAKVVHAYERKIPIEEDLYCDFYIPTGKVYIEYWGLEDPQYLARKAKKLEIYKKYEMDLIQLGEKDVSNLDDILPGKLLEFGVPVE